MRLVIQDDAKSVGELVAAYVVKRINDFKPTATRPFVLGLPTGSSPLKAYQALVVQYKEGKVSFQHVITFNMDEYCGLPRDHPESYHSFMWENLFKHIDIQPQNANILDGNAPDLLAPSNFGLKSFWVPQLSQVRPAWVEQLWPKVPIRAAQRPFVSV